MNNEIKSETEANTECFIHLVIGEVVCHETDVARQLKQGKSFAEHNKTVFDVAMAVAKFYQEQLDLRMDAYARERKALAEIEKLKQYIKKVCAESSSDIQKLDAENKKLKEELSRCRAANADYLTAKTEAENRAKLLEKEVADIKVPYNRRERRLRDELHKSRIECQKAWEKANEELTENKELREHNNALQRQLDGLKVVKSYIKK